MDNLDPLATLGTQETRQRQTEKLTKEEPTKPGLKQCAREG